MATMVLSNILGLFRNRFLAQKIPSADLDTYLAAFRIPDLIFNLLILGAISSAFIPIFTGFIRKNQQKEAWHIANSVINIAIVLLIVICGLLALFMPNLMPHIVPGFSALQKTQTVNLSRILLLTPLFFGLSYIFGGILNSFKRFIVYSLAPLVYNISIILATLFLADQYSVYGVAAGVVGGSFLHMMIQFPVVWKMGFRWKGVLDFRHKAVRRIGKLMLPRIVGLGANQIVLIIATFLASMWVGNVTYFNFANDIQTFFSVVFGASFAIAIFPFFADYAADNDQKKFRETFGLAAKQILYFIIPSSVLLILLRVEIVRLILGTGHYDWEATINTANALGAFAIGVWAASLIQLLARAFYAFENTRTPAIVSVISTIFTIILSFVLSKLNIGVINIFGHTVSTPLKAVGIAYAVSLGSILNALILIIILKKQLGAINGKNFAITVFKYIFCSIIIGVLAQLSKNIIGNNVNMQTFFGVFAKAVGSILISAVVYIFLTYLLKCEELSAFIEVFKKKVTPPADIPIDQKIDSGQSQES